MKPPPKPKPKPFKSPRKPKKKKGWEDVSSWYRDIVGEKGHYYHRQVILPRMTEIFQFKKGQKAKLLDLACGQGVLGRHIPSHIEYWGVDLAPSFIKEAKKLSKSHALHRYSVADVSKPLSIDRLPKDFDWVTVILALQDIEDMAGVFANAYRQLKKGGQLLIVLNHPCFRIPRQTHWAVDEEQKLQYRRVDRYMSHLQIPIRTKPSQEKQSPVVHSHHRPLSDYFSALSEAGFLVSGMEEWVSDKKSTGTKAAMENRARKEFPLFMAIRAVKKEG